MERGYGQIGKKRNGDGKTTILRISKKPIYRLKAENCTHVIFT